MADLGPVLRRLAIALLDAPMAVTLICPSGSDLAGLPVGPMGLVHYSSARLPFLRRRAIESAGQDVVAAGVTLLHALDAAALPLTRRLANEADLNYVAGACSLANDVRAADHRCRALLAASDPIRQMLVETHAAPAEMIRLIRPGVHQARSATCFIDPNHATAIVASGPMDSSRVFSAVIEAFAQLIQAGRECVFFVVGNGRAESRLRRQAEKLDLMGQLTFVDRQDPEELAGILIAADIFISPAPSDRLDIELLTSMAAGVPVLTTEVGPADFIIPDKTALIFKADDSVELAVKLFSLLDDIPSARSLAEAALAHLHKNHSPAKMAELLLRLYHDVARAPARAD